MKSTYLRAVFTVHLFYFVLCVIHIIPFYDGLTSGRTLVPLNLVEILRWIPLEYFTAGFKLTNIAGLIFFTLAAIFPFKRWLRVLSFLSMFFYVAFFSSFIKENHGYYGFLLSAIALILLPKIACPYDESKVTEEQRNLVNQAVFMAQFGALCCYSLAGLWKVRYIPIILSNGGWEKFVTVLGNSIAYEHLTYNYPLTAISDFFMSQNELTTFLFLGLISLQVLSCLLVFFTGAHIYLGLLLLLFHLMSEIVLKIPFHPQMYLVIVLFLFSPFAHLKFWQKKSLHKAGF